MGSIVFTTAGLNAGGGGGAALRAVGGKGWSGVAKAGEEEYAVGLFESIAMILV